MSQLDQIHDAFIDSGWFQSPGAYVLVDGSFGSTGKGALAALIAATVGDQIDVVTTNAGPNSGHTGFGAISKSHYWDRRVVTRQIPVTGSTLLYPLEGINHVPLVYLNAGAVIDPVILRREARENFVSNRLIVHPCAAIIDDDHRVEPASVQAIASTGKGVGLALSRKVLREHNVAKFRQETLNDFCDVREFTWDWSRHRVFVETAQGFSLGINQARFFPHTTSRDCSVQQAIADAQIPWNKVRKVIMSVRTFPIRVGSTEQGSSGPCYSDQEETTWEALGVEPEYTTVTKRVRRVFTWSRQQFREAVATNQPQALFVTFADYFKTGDEFVGFMRRLLQDYGGVMGQSPEFVLIGRGPRPEDVSLMDRDNYV